MRKKITAIVPVRKGSERVKNKNFKDFAGTNLLSIKLNTLLQINTIDKIIVSTDSDEAIETAELLGVDVHNRDPYYASSAVNNSEYFQNLAENIKSEYLMYSPVTCPLISKETYVDSINTFQSASVTNLVTVAPVKHHMWLDGKPLNYDIKNSPNSQDLPDIYSITYGICILSRNDMITYRNIITNTPTFKVLNEVESIDIDTPLDFEFAEFMYKKLKL
jgi:N-acylneuraminate cytidylyltransferase